MKPHCWQCDRYKEHHHRDECRLPIPRDLWCDHVEWTSADPRVQNANCDCQYFAPKRSWTQKVEDFLIWSGK